MMPRNEMPSLPSSRAVGRVRPHATAPHAADQQDRSRRVAPRGRLLVVDDDEGARVALERLLMTEGFNTETAADGVSALVEAAREPPDLVITDLKMPGMDGVELTAQLHALDPDLPVIVVTGHSDTTSAIESLRNGVEDYLVKPLDFDMLVHRIVLSLERRGAKAEIARLAEKLKVINERLALSTAREHEHAVIAERQQARWSALLENLSDGVFIADRAGRIVMANRAAHQLWLGTQSVGDITELHALTAFRLDGEPYESKDRPLARAIRGEVFDECELLVSRADGDLRRLISSGTNVRGPDGQVALAIVVFRDVTELRRLEHQRDEYVALISHDLRGPLSSILLSASLLKESVSKHVEGEELRMVEQIARNAQRMNGMIGDLLESKTLESQGVKLTKQRCDLRRIVDSIVQDLDDGRRHRVQVEGDVNEAPVLADPAKIERAISNLLGNALKYSPNEAAVRLVLGVRDDHVQLEVVDHGIGIAKVHVPRLFERYYRVPTGKRYSGLGLGLYITGLIVHAHGGEIEVESEVGKGSTFRMLLPSIPPPPPSERAG